jgi:NADPH:quinone reductase-like Zn-dependent oxidoreductase
MRAAVRDRYGPPEVLRVAGDVPVPVPGDGEVLVKVRATTVNRTDTALRAAYPFFWRLATGVRRPKAAVIGSEYAGEVAAVGPGVTAFDVGDRVFGWEDRTWGAHAQFMVTRVTGAIARIPDGETYASMAPATEGAHYARDMVRAAALGPGDDVLVNGATGGIGSAAVQLLHDLGARVTATCGPEHLELVSGLGADRVLDHTATDFTAGDERYDAVLDAVGKSTFGRCRRLLKPGGVYLSSDLGPFWQNVPLALLTPLGRGRRVRFPFPRADPAMARYFGELVAAGRFRPLVDRTYPLDDIVEAHRYVDSGRKIGNVVILVDHPD